MPAPSGPIIGGEHRLTDYLDPEQGPFLYPDLLFESCWILGPAIMPIPECRLVGDSFMEIGIGWDSVFWLIDTPSKIGLLRPNGATFVRCKFRGIGFAGQPDQIAAAKHQMTPLN